MEIKKLDSPVSISDSALVRLKEMGNITEIMYSEKRSRGGYITKIDKDHYVDNRTGELFEFKHLENRAQDLANVAKSLAQGRASYWKLSFMPLSSSPRLASSAENVRCQGCPVGVEKSFLQEKFS